MLPTLTDVLDLPVVRAGRPQVLAGTASLDRPVRWVHVSELGDLAGLLQGGELVLTTGLALDAPGADPGAYVEALAGAGACGLVVELGERLPAAPAPLVAGAERLGFPLVALRAPVRFVAVTEVVHSLIVGEQYRQVRFAQQVHEVFTALSLEGASTPAIVARAAVMAGEPVVLEDLAHHVAAHDPAGTATPALLDRWPERSRRTPWSASTAVAGPEGWLTTPVGVGAGRWGRLVMPAGGDEAGLGDDAPGPQGRRMLLERAAQALELGRMVERDRAALEHRAHGGLLEDLLTGRAGSEEDARARAEALGLPRSRTLLAVAVQGAPAPGADPLAAQRHDRRLREAVTRALGVARARGLVAAVHAGHAAQVVALVAAPDGPRGPRDPDAAAERLLERLATAVHAQLADAPGMGPGAVGVGRATASLLEAGPALREAGHVAEVASAAGAGPRPFARSGDLRLRGLLSLLREDPRVQAFAESELHRLLQHDAARRDGLLDLLRQHLEVGGNKTELARRTHLSRPALYARLAVLERVLGVDLTAAESRTALHVALLAHDEAARAAGPLRDSPFSAHVVASARMSPPMNALVVASAYWGAREGRGRPRTG